MRATAFSAPSRLASASSWQVGLSEEVEMSRVSVRYIIDDVPAAMRFYTTLLGFTVERDASPAFASVVRDGVRLLLSGDGSSGKRPLPDGRAQVPGVNVSDLGL